MKQAPAGSFAVWSSCLLQWEGLPFVDAVVWGFWGNWFLYLPDLLGGDLLCTLVQAVEFTEKINAQRLGWVFSPYLVCFPCVIWPGAASKCCIQSNPKLCSKPWALLSPPVMRGWWRPCNGTSHHQLMTWITSQKSSQGQSQRQPHWMGTPHFVHCRCHWAGQTANYLPREHFPIDSNIDSKGRTGFSKEQTDTKRARTINLHTHKKNNIYLSIYMWGKVRF